MATGVYATDSDLTDRVASASLATESQRALALLDAMQEIDARVFGDMTTEAHAMLAAHKLSVRGFMGAASGATVTSKRAGAIAVTYAVGTSSAGPNAGTAYGRAFDVIAAKAGHAPLTDSTDTWLSSAILGIPEDGGWV